MTKKTKYSDIIAECSKEFKEHNKKVKALSKQGIAIFENAAKKIFELNPKLKSFSWTQYTPSWNDGDACYFGVYSDMEMLKLNEISLQDVEVDEHGDIAIEKIKEWEGIEEPLELGEAICNLIDSVDEDVLETYGEGEITLKRSGKVSCDSSVGDY